MGQIRREVIWLHFSHNDLCLAGLMASPPTLAPSTKETTNYARLCRLLVDGGTKALRYTFDKFHSPANLFNVLKAGSAEHLTLQSLKKRKSSMPHSGVSFIPLLLGP